MWISVTSAARIYNKSTNNYYCMACLDRKRGRTDRFKYVGDTLFIDVNKTRIQDDGEYTIKEIADALGLTKGQVSHALESGMKKIRDKLIEMGFNEDD